MKPSVLIFIDWFYPAFKAGGPVKSVYNIIQNLKSEYQFSVVTSDRDIDNEFVRLSEKESLNEWIQKDGYQVIYLSPEYQNTSFYKQLAKEIDPDWTYFNSLFSKNFTLKPYKAFKKSKIKQMIAPRGMLGKGALRIKPLKKKLFLKVARQFLFDKHTYWHATSRQEANEISREIGVLQEKIRIASNLASPLAQDFKMLRKEDAKIRLFFLSRISTKKNLLFILKLLQELPELEALVFDIYGPIENDGHWDQCKPIIEGDARVNYKNEIHPQQIPEMISKYHMLVLPTLHENYGHAIAETLSQGRPVIISDQTPWQGLDSKLLGVDLSLENTAQWKEKLKRFYEMSDSQFQELCKASFEFAKREVGNQKSIEDSKRLFE